jgi:hypothetical protein
MPLGDKHDATNYIQHTSIHEYSSVMMLASLNHYLEIAHTVSAYMDRFITWSQLNMQMRKRRQNTGIIFSSLLKQQKKWLENKSNQGNMAEIMQK